MNYNHEWNERNLNKPRQVYPMPSPNEFVNELMDIYIPKRGLSLEIARANGWYGSNNAGDRYGRVVVPAINRVDIPYWQARLIGNSLDLAPRYQSPYYSRFDSLIVVKPLVFNSTAFKVAIAEGAFDALALAELGYVSVALMGNKPPSIVWDHFAERYTEVKWMPSYRRVVTLVADQDSIGATTMWQAELGLRGFRSVIRVPEGAKDIAAMRPEDRITFMNAKTSKMGLA